MHRISLVISKKSQNRSNQISRIKENSYFIHLEKGIQFKKNGLTQKQAFKFSNLNEEKLFDTQVYTDIGTQKEKRGVLTIVPTPIGNLKDLSIRQYQALLEADIIACEDTRVTGHMLTLIKNKRITDSFKNTFNVDFSSNEQANNQELKDQENFDEGDKALALIDEFEQKDLAFSGEKLEESQRRPTREERLISKIIEIRQKARKLLQEQDNLNIYEDQKKWDDEFDGSFYGLEDEFINYLKAKIAKSKQNKGRGILISYHKYNEDMRIARLVKILNYGLNIALVSDAGTPTISDPGYLLVNRCIKENIPINSLPGSSAVLVALSSSGFPSDRFLFEGYLSKNQLEKEQKLERIKNMGITSVFFENLNRLPKSLLSIEKYFGEKQIIFIGFEFTKLFEKKYRGPVRELYEELTDPEKTKQSHLKGEITLVIPPHTPEFNIDLFTIQDDKQIQKQTMYKEWNKQVLSEEEQQILKEQASFNEDFTLSKQKNNQKENINLKQQQEKEKLDQNHIFQVDGKMLGQYLNDNLDVSQKDLADILSDILKISKNRSYNLVKSVKSQNTHNQIWNQLLNKKQKK